MSWPQEPERPGRHRIDAVQDPADPSRKAFAWITTKTLQNVLNRSAWKYVNLKTALEVLRAPERVYHGVREDDQGAMEEGGWCCAGRPRFLRRKDSSTYPFPENAVFLVFVSEMGDVYEWRYEDCDPGEPSAPKGADRRFGELKWRKKT